MAASPAPDIAQIDGGSSLILLDGVEAYDNRTPAYQKGVASSGAHVTVKNEKYQGVAAGDNGVSIAEILNQSDIVAYNVPSAGGYQWSVGGNAIGGINSSGLQWYSAGNGVTVSAPAAAFSAYQMTWPTTPGTSGRV